MTHSAYEGGQTFVSLPSGPISSAFTIHLRANTSTDVVTAQVRGSDVIRTGVYIYGFPTLEVDAPTGRETGSEDSPGKPGEVLRNAFTATVKDGGNSVRYLECQSILIIGQTVPAHWCLAAVIRVLLYR